MILLRTIFFLSCLFIFNSNNEVEEKNNKTSTVHKWSVEGIHVNSFVENKGQFDYRPISINSPILYVIDNGMEQIYFTKKGISYYFEKREKNPDRPKGDRTMSKKIRIKEAVHFEWENSNPDVEVIAEDERDDYFIYSFSGKGKSNFDFTEIKAQGFQKLIYKEIYPKIDIEYIFHSKGGIKYNVILHPGADLTQFKMNYISGHKPSIKNGEVKISTLFGTITEHKPKTFYADNKSEIPSEFAIDETSVVFQLGNYDKSKELIIDPWVQTPSNPNSNCVWEVETDASGNVYIIGGDSPMRLQKYNSTGVLQWTHNTPYNINPDSMWLGTLASDQAGNSYVTNGSTAAIQRVNTNGSVDWNNTSSLFDSDEYWCIAFNSDQTKMFIGGTVNASGNPITPDLKAAVFDINTGNGNINASQIVASGSMFSFPPNPALQEVRSITAAPNSQYYYLTHDTIGAIYEGFANSVCTENIKFKIDHSFKLGYKCENYRPSNGNAGIKAIKANNQFVYIQDGETIQKRSLLDGTVLGIANIPSGINITNLGLSQVGNSGIAIDDCGNVYVGSSNAVIKYDPDLNIISSYSTPYRVYDVSIGDNGEILLAGSTGNNSSSSRVGYVESVNMSACAPLALTNCDAIICPPEEFCPSDPPSTLTANSPGGTWSGPGITNASTGAFDPSIAGAGQHTIAYTKTCGSDTTIVTVKECVLEVCAESNNDLTANGVAPYTWESQVLDCSSCPFGNCFPPICNGIMAWQAYSTNQTSTPPDYPVRVTDENGDIVVINAITDVPLCPDSCAALSLDLSNINNPNCFGDTNGSFTLTINGFMAPYEYTLTEQGGAIDNFTSSNTTESFSGLSAQIYLINVTDAEACSADTTLAITEPDELNVTIIDTTNASCTGNDGSATVSATGGTPNYTYSWSGSAGNSATVNNLSAGVYFVTVEDANGCTTNSSVSIGSTDGPEVELDSVFNVSCPGANDGAIDILISGGTLPYVFDWNNGDDTQNISDLAPGTYSLSVIDANNCSVMLTAEVGVEDEISISSNITGSGCDGNASIVANASGGTPTYTYDWSNGGNSNTITDLSSGTYTLTVTDDNGCTTIDSFAVSNNGSFTIALSSTSTTCQGVNNGLVSSNVNGATPPLSYEWSNGATTSDLQNVGSGTYTVTITDGNNCTVSNSETVTEQNFISAIATISDVVCENDTDGGIKLTPFNGSEPYSATWSNGSTNITQTGLTAGNYSVTVTDSAGCEFDTTYTISSLSNFTIQASSSGLACDENTGASITVSVLSGSTGPYTYDWSTGDQTATVENIGAGTYTVVVTDSLNCEKRDTTSVFNSSFLIEEEIINASCPDEADGAISLNIEGGNPPFTFNWDNGLTDSVLTYLLAGVYDLTVTDEDDCSRTASFEVFVVENGDGNCDSLMIYDVFSPNGDGRNDLWIIDGLQDYPNNSLQIFSRWGNIVYEISPYENTWDGSNMNGKAMATGTYYYVLKLNDGSDEVYSGHINLIR